MSITLVFRRKCIYICTRLEYIHPTEFCEAGPDALYDYGLSHSLLCEREHQIDKLRPTIFRFANLLVFWSVVQFMIHCMRVDVLIASPYCYPPLCLKVDVKNHYDEY